MTTTPGPTPPHVISIRVYPSSSGNELVSWGLAGMGLDNLVNVGYVDNVDNMFFIGS